MGLVDFEKAFDTVEHRALWATLADQGIDSGYLEVLQRLYGSQSATVMAGAESRSFSLQRGVKQGDPLSALLFIAVMEQIFRTLKDKWCNLNSGRQGPYYGVVIDRPEDPLTNLRFADDVLLFASSSQDVSAMIADLSCEARKFGLKLHAGKTVVMTTAAVQPQQLDCGGFIVKTLSATESEKYLGKKLSMEDYHDVELANRIAASWGAFMRFKEVLCNNRLALDRRMKLFESVVTPSALYGCASWTMTLERERKLTVARRRMLRWMMAVRRGKEESWPDYIQRSTKLCEATAEKHGAKQWVLLQRLRKWKFAGLTAARADNRWSHRLLTWTPWFRTSVYRRVGRPSMRWGDDICKFAGASWLDAAKDPSLWEALSIGFAKRCV